ncbi:YceI family protein [Elongatibacter sediminis]|uniref:YceI family protein n=1 Tax=Elongatibacter sediminis TaxID=3119006 RepID=A0AAW9RIZ6_9GAMM
MNGHHLNTGSPRAGRLLSGLLLIATAATACTAPEPTKPPVPGSDTPAWIDLAPYRQGLDAGEVYRVVPERSRTDIVVRRGGALQRLGHDHVVTLRKIDGYVRHVPGSSRESRADLVIELVSAEVDETAARSVWGLDTSPGAEDIERTRSNLLERVLETDRWPLARIELIVLSTDAESVEAAATLYIKGQAHRFPVTALLVPEDGRLRAVGAFALRQSDLGIEPFSVLGGALRVADRVEIAFQIEADRISRLDPVRTH